MEGRNKTIRYQAMGLNGLEEAYNNNNNVKKYLQMLQVLKGIECEL